jgi:hypothetical protein
MDDDEQARREKLMGILRTQLTQTERDARENTAYVATGSCVAVWSDDGSFAYAASCKNADALEARLVATTAFLHTMRSEVDNPQVAALLEKALRCVGAAREVRSGEAFASRTVH